MEKNVEMTVFRPRYTYGQTVYVYTKHGLVHAPVSKVVCMQSADGVKEYYKFESVSEDIYYLDDIKAVNHYEATALLKQAGKQLTLLLG